MERLIGAVLKLAREGRRPLKAESIDLREIVTGAAEAIQHQLSEADGKIDIELDVATIQSDRFSIEMIVGNLLDNAVKYRERDRPLRIEVRTRAIADDRVEIEVADKAAASRSAISRVFDLFKRSGTQEQPGDGIGLAYVLRPPQPWRRYQPDKRTWPRHQLSPDDAARAACNRESCRLKRKPANRSRSAMSGVKAVGG